MDIPALLGKLAALISTLSLFPQVLKIYREKSAQEVSVTMIVSFLVAAVCWVVYGISKGASEVVWSNVLFFIFSVWILGLKFYYRKTK